MGSQVPLHTQDRVEIPVLLGLGPEKISWLLAMLGWATLGPLSRVQLSRGFKVQMARGVLRRMLQWVVLAMGALVWYYTG